jgi:Ca2+-binding EF-hand superfamily protein
MKRALFPLCLAAVLAFTGCSTAPKKPATVEELFRQADSNGDGKVSRREYEDFMIEQMFVQFDSNGDAVITEAEFVADGGTKETFRRINVSGTGKVTLAEAKNSTFIRNRLAKPFDEADINQSGYVTWDEFQVARAKARSYVR